jgi:hypothetical protein
MDIRKKLNESGFGVDPEKDATLDKGLTSLFIVIVVLLLQCTYFVHRLDN